MDIKKYFEERIAKRETELEEIRLRREKEITQIEFDREDIRVSPLVPEKTDTLEKLNAANGRQVKVYSNGWNSTGTLDFDGRINVDGTSYPVIGSAGSEVLKVVDLETNELIFENKYVFRSTVYQTAMLLGRQAGLEEAQARIDSERRSIQFWEKDLQDLKDGYAKVPEYIEKGNKLIYPQRKEEWEKCVCTRLSDLYSGMDLDNALQIMEALDNGVTVEEAGKLVDDGHSGMSYGVTMSIVLTFSKRGVEFCKAMNSDYKYDLEHDSERAAKWEARFAEVDAQNQQYAKAEKGNDGKGEDGGKK